MSNVLFIYNTLGKMHISINFGTISFFWDFFLFETLFKFTNYVCRFINYVLITTRFVIDYVNIYVLG